MTKILADDLANNQVSSLVQFMESASDGKLALRGKRMEITGPTKRKVKFLLHKFLHTNRLSGYGVLDTEAALEIIRIRPEAKRTRNETPNTRTPFMPIHPPPTALEPSLVIE